MYNNIMYQEDACSRTNLAGKEVLMDSLYLETLSKKRGVDMESYFAIFFHDRRSYFLSKSLQRCLYLPRKEEAYRQVIVIAF